MRTTLLPLQVINQSGIIKRQLKQYKYFISTKSIYKNDINVIVYRKMTVKQISAIDYYTNL
tara:strand:- start:3299 stop:3481 length:183 start_codon:yes stop_codon:yes gene_type:complete